MSTPHGLDENTIRDEHAPERPLPPPPTLSELLEVFRARIRLRYPWMDPVWVVLAVAALTGVGGMAWAVLGTSPNQAVHSSSPEPTTMRSNRIVGSSTTTASTTSRVPGIVVIDAAGAVAHPGLVRVPDGARVDDVIAAAGGTTADADLERIDRASKVYDGQRVYVPRIGQQQLPALVENGGGAPQPSGSQPNASHTSQTDGPVDLNTADVTQLDSLPGVGPSTAQAIVEYRSSSGPFKTVDDLLNVRGIGPAKLAALRQHVTT